MATLIERLAKENPARRYQRIQGELLSLITESGLRDPPHPAAKPETCGTAAGINTTWRQFLRALASTTLAATSSTEIAHSPSACDEDRNRILNE